MVRRLSPGASAALELAKKADVAVTADCQCEGIFIDGHQYAGGKFCMDIGVPTHVPAEVIAALIEHAIELEPWLRVSGTVRPSALAVLRLITSSNLVGSMTGKSPGLTPLRTLPT